jgi:hypothetical protein
VEGFQGFVKTKKKKIGNFDHHFKNMYLARKVV